MAVGGRWFRPGPWVAPSLLVGSVAMSVVVVATAVQLGRSGMCEMSSGDSAVGTSGLSMVPFGPTCSLDGVVEGPAPIWSALVVLFVTLASAAAVRLVVRPDPSAGSGAAGRSATAGVLHGWSQAGPVGGAAGAGAVMACAYLLWGVRYLVLAPSGPRVGGLAAAFGVGLFMGVVGAFVGLIGGAVLCAPTAVVCRWVERRVPAVGPGSYAVLAAAVAAPAVWCVVASVLHAFGTGASGVALTASVLAAAVAVAAVPVGAWAWTIAHRGGLTPPGRPVASAG